MRGEKYFHSFGVTGRDHWSAGFQHFWMHGLTRGHEAGYDDYCLELNAAYAGKFAHLPDNRVNYAYHLDATRYARFLRQLAEADGAVRVEGKIAEVALRSGERQHCRAYARFRPADRRRPVPRLHRLPCAADRGALHVGYDDWTHYLPCDAAIAIQTASVRPAIPYTRAIAHDAGWQWRIPLQHRQGNGIVYCSRYLEREAALERLLATIEGDKLIEPNMLRFVTGARRKQWHRNCIAVGLSGGFLEPLESTSIHLIQRAVLRLIRMLPFGEVSERDVAEFNDQQMTDMYQVRDFLILHYKATERRDSAFWRQCAQMEIPESLQQKIELFRETGRVFRKNEELFAENSWVQVMMGQGLRRSPITRSQPSCPDEELAKLLDGLRQSVAQTVADMPEHHAYVARYCGAQEAQAAA